MNVVMTRLALVVLLAAMAAAPGFAAQETPDLTGTWVGTTAVPDVGDNPITLQLKREGDAYAGTCTDGAGIIVDPVVKNVALKDGTLTFDIGVSNGADVFPVHISLKVEGDTMTGYWTTDQGESGAMKLTKKVT